MRLRVRRSGAVLLYLQLPWRRRLADQLEVLILESVPVDIKFLLARLVELDVTRFQEVVLLADYLHWVEVGQILDAGCCILVPWPVDHALIDEILLESRKITRFDLLSYLLVFVHLGTRVDVIVKLFSRLIFLSLLGPYHLRRLLWKILRVSLRVDWRRRLAVGILSHKIGHPEAHRRLLLLRSTLHADTHKTSMVSCFLRRIQLLIACNLLARSYHLDLVPRRAEFVVIAHVIALLVALASWLGL